MKIFYFILGREAFLRNMQKKCYLTIDFEDFFKQASQQTFNNFFQKTFMVVEKLSLKEGGYRIVTNTGKNGGQIVFHFHIHI